MMPDQFPDDPLAATGCLGDGCSFVYVLPYADEDWLKLGFSTNPLSRFQAFHRRWFEVFDLQRALLIETETQRESRQIELQLRHELKIHRAPAPLIVDPRAGGNTEWLRGALQVLHAHAQKFRQRGYRVHQPPVLWLHHAMHLRRDGVRAWIVYWNEQIETSGPHDPMVLTVRTMIRDATDAYLALNSLCAQTDEQTHKEWL